MAKHLVKAHGVSANELDWYSNKHPSHLYADHEHHHDQEGTDPWVGHDFDSKGEKFWLKPGEPDVPVGIFRDRRGK